MSRINIHKIEADDVDRGPSDLRVVALPEEFQHSLREGEELMAAETIIGALDALDNGEVLVITREIW